MNRPAIPKPVKIDAQLVPAEPPFRADSDQVAFVRLSFRGPEDAEIVDLSMEVDQEVPGLPDAPENFRFELLPHRIPPGLEAHASWPLTVRLGDSPRQRIARVRLNWIYPIDGRRHAARASIYVYANLPLNDASQEAQELSQTAAG